MTLGSAVTVDDDLSEASKALPEFWFVPFAAVAAFWMFLVNSANACSDEGRVLTGGAYGFRD